MCWGNNLNGQLGDGTYTSGFAEVNSNQFNLISGNGINQNGDGLFERFQYDGLSYHIIAENYGITSTDECYKFTVMKEEWRYSNKEPSLDICASQNYADNIPDFDFARKSSGEFYLTVNFDEGYYSGSYSYTNACEVWAYVIDSRSSDYIGDERMTSSSSSSSTICRTYYPGSVGDIIEATEDYFLMDGYGESFRWDADANFGPSISVSSSSGEFLLANFLCVADDYLRCYYTTYGQALSYNNIEYHDVLINEHNRAIVLCSTATSQNALCALSIETEINFE